MDTSKWLKDYEWFDFCTNCHSMDYRHPSGVRVCLDKPAKWHYEECEQETCPKLNKELDF